MSNRLPVEVNPFRLIEQQRQLNGSLLLSQFPRLADLLTDDSGEVAVALDFMRTVSKLPAITGQVRGQLSLQCQRCLQPVAFTLDSAVNVVVTTSQTDRRPEDQGYEVCIVEDERLFLLDFIEDEILLALPVIPRHDDCEPVKPLLEVTPDDLIDNEHAMQQERDNPFAVLKDWKKPE